MTKMDVVRRVDDFPKLESPFVREEIGNDYIVTDEINEGYEWVFENEDVIAVEKLHGCFNYDTVINSNEGTIPIGKIVNNKLNVKVLTYNFDTKTCEYKNITNYHKRDTNKEWLCIKILLPHRGGNNRTLLCTENHKIYTNEGFKEASKIEENETVFTYTDSFPEVLKQIVMGTAIGDGTIELIHENTPTISFTHGEKQWDYLKFKKKIFGNLVTNDRNIGKGGYEGSKERREVRIQTNPILSKLIKETLIKDGEKSITNELTKKINPLGLAIWYMDDGSLSYVTNEQRPSIQFATNSFSNEECEKIHKMLIERFGIDNKVIDYGDGNQIFLNANSTERFCSLIYPYVPKSMEYKLLEEYRNTPICLTDNVPDLSNQIIEGKVVEKRKPKDWRNTTKMYDLSIEDNNNYFAGGILVHNSNVSVWIEDGKITGVWNRKKRIPYWSDDRGDQYIVEGIHESLNRGYVDRLKDGQHFGELIGTKIQDNPYNLDTHIWIPFAWLKDHCAYKSWGKYPKTFDSISDWFEEGLIPLFYCKWNGVDIETAEEEGFVEGIVFYHPDGRKSKLRQDMFDWYEGERH